MGDLEKLAYGGSCSRNICPDKGCLNLFSLSRGNVINITLRSRFKYIFHYPINSSDGGTEPAALSMNWTAASPCTKPYPVA